MQLRRSWVKRLTLSFCTRISVGRVPWVFPVKLRKYRNILSNYTNNFLPHSSQYFIRYHFIIRRHIKLAASLNKAQINTLVSFMTLWYMCVLPWCGPYQCFSRSSYFSAFPRLRLMAVLQAHWNTVDTNLIILWANLTYVSRDFNWSFNIHALACGVIAACLSHVSQTSHYSLSWQKSCSWKL